MFSSHTPKWYGAEPDTIVARYRFAVAVRSTSSAGWGTLFLCGDAAHIVSPTDAKSLNTAAYDVHYLYFTLFQYYEDHDDEGLERYSDRAPTRVWKAERFSWWMTNLLHRFPDRDDFDVKMQQAEFRILCDQQVAQVSLVINYAGLPCRSFGHLNRMSCDYKDGAPFAAHPRRASVRSAFISH